MSLIYCPECKKEISEYAVQCPNCGCPMEIINAILEQQSLKKAEEEKRIAEQMKKQKALKEGRDKNPNKEKMEAYFKKLREYLLDREKQIGYFKSCWTIKSRDEEKEEWKLECEYNQNYLVLEVSASKEKDKSVNAKLYANGVYGDWILSGDSIERLATILKKKFHLFDKKDRVKNVIYKCKQESIANNKEEYDIAWNNIEEKYVKEVVYIDNIRKEIKINFLEAYLFDIEYFEKMISTLYIQPDIISFMFEIFEDYSYEDDMCKINLWDNIILRNPNKYNYTLSKANLRKIRNSVSVRRSNGEYSFISPLADIFIHYTKPYMIFFSGQLIVGNKYDFLEYVNYFDFIGCKKNEFINDYIKMVDENEENYYRSLFEHNNIGASGLPFMRSFAQPIQLGTSSNPNYKSFFEIYFELPQRLCVVNSNYYVPWDMLDFIKNASASMIANISEPFVFNLIYIFSTGTFKDIFDELALEEYTVEKLKPVIKNNKIELTCLKDIMKFSVYLTENKSIIIRVDERKAYYKSMDTLPENILIFMKKCGFEK